MVSTTSDSQITKAEIFQLYHYYQRNFINYYQQAAEGGLVAEVRTLTENLRQDNPLNGFNVDVGCMTSAEQLAIVAEQVEDARMKGAKILTGGKRSPKGHMFWEPTVIVDVKPGMRVIEEETFGPVMPIMPFKDEDEVIKKANDTNYGLCAYIFSRDRKNARRIAEHLVAGTIVINESLLTHGIPETPWIGAKESSIGRVHSDDALKDLSLMYHVNYDRLPMPRFLRKFWTWPPYSAQNITRFHSLLGLTDLPGSIRTKMGLLARLFFPGNQLLKEELEKNQG